MFRMIANLIFKSSRSIISYSGYQVNYFRKHKSFCQHVLEDWGPNELVKRSKSVNYRAHLSLDNIVLPVYLRSFK